MKIVALIGAALLATGTFATAPADAQPRYGYGHGYDRHDRGWRDDRGWRGDRHGWRGGPRARSRVVCRVQRGYYGPERRCFRVWR